MKKLLVLLAAAACAVCLALGLAACTVDGNGGENGGEQSGNGQNAQGGQDVGHVHNFGDLIPEIPATCTESGVAAHYFCEGCQKYFDGEKQETTLDALKIDINPDGHSFADGKCKYCEKVLYVKNADDGTITMGEYPQSEVEDSGLKVTLGLEASNGELPTADNAHGWTDYGYYIESEVQSFMWHIDVEYESNRYRGVYFTSYRGDTTTDSNSYSYQDDNGYDINNVYWFKFEPIEWRILSQSDGTALLMSNIILDSRQYYHEDKGTRTIADNTVYPTNYKESDIREWLNDTFYKTSFDELTKSIIQETEVDNSAENAFMNDAKFACENTHDKIFLLSPTDITNSEYGFADDVATPDSARLLNSTAYAKAQGVNVARTGYSWWWLRSPMNEKMAHYIHDNGAGKTRNVVNTCVGVVPALRIKL